MKIYGDYIEYNKIYFHSNLHELIFRIEVKIIMIIVSGDYHSHSIFFSSAEITKNTAK